jgi:peptidoglycan hydrolase-like protein with peptidoglycan-binding domain
MPFPNPTNTHYSAVKAFQKRVGLPQDGIVGDLLKAAALRYRTWFEFSKIYH